MTRAEKKLMIFLFCAVMFFPLITLHPQAYAEEITLGTVQELTPTDEDVLLSAWSPDGKKIAYVKRDASSMGIFNIWVKEIGSATPPIQITQDTDNVWYLTSLAWSLDGTRVIFETGMSAIAAAEADGSLVVSTILSDPAKFYYMPDISMRPTDNKLLYTEYPVGGYFNLFCMAVNDRGDPVLGTEVQLTNFSSWSPGYPEWSYSGDALVFMLEEYSIYVLTGVQDIINGIELPPTSLADPRMVIIKDNFNPAAPSDFSFDERLVFYFEDVNGAFMGAYPIEAPVSDWLVGCNFDPFYMNADGSGVPQKIDDQPYNQGYMVASPDGTWISYISDQQGPDVDIFIASLLVSEEITTDGGTVVDGSGTSVDIPAGALPGTTTITIETPPLDNIPPSTIPMVTARDFGPDGVVFSQPVTITIHYTDASVAGFDEANLEIYYYNEASESWEPLGGVVNTEANTITVTVDHFSLFAVMEKPAASALSSFTIFATNSVWLRKGSQVNSGNVGVCDASLGPWLNSQSEVSVGKSVYVADDISIYGDSIKVKVGASVYDVYYNELVNNGTIRGEENTPLELPLDVTLPDFPTPSPGSEDIVIPRGGSLILEPGSYGKVMVRSHASLILTGGVYHLENLNLGDKNAKVLFQGPTDVIINNRLKPGPKAVIGPEDGSDIGAQDIRIYVNGINGNTGKLGATPKAAVIGQNNTVTASIYAPNGTLWIKHGSVAQGAFIAKDVKIGKNVEVTLDSAF